MYQKQKNLTNSFYVYFVSDCTVGLQELIQERKLARKVFAHLSEVEDNSRNSISIKFSLFLFRLLCSIHVWWVRRYGPCYDMWYENRVMPYNTRSHSL